MLLLLFIVPSLVSILGMFFFRKDVAKMRIIFKGTSLFLLGIALYACYSYSTSTVDSFITDWTISFPILTHIGASFSLSFTGISVVMGLLTSIAFAVVSFMEMPAKVATDQAYTYYALLQLLCFGLLGVFLSNDAFFFYFFWELTLIPVYFLSSLFGGENRLRVTFSFLMYTITASLLMLAGIICMYDYAGSSFLYDTFLGSDVNQSPNHWIIFCLMFVGFAVKTPIFPFHTWQANLYEQSPTQLSLILSSVVAKMGLYGIFRWILPILPSASNTFATFVTILSVIGVIYGAVIAIRRGNIKTLLAYSSLSHLGLMSVGLFTSTTAGLEGALFQFFAHGVVNIGLWLVVYHIERLYKTTTISELSGLMYVYSFLSFFLIAFGLANISLPITANFVGEWMMFVGLFSSPVLPLWALIVSVVFAGLSIVLGAVYTLPMIRKVIYGNEQKVGSIALNTADKTILVLLLGIVLFLGVYPSYLLHMFGEEVQMVIEALQNTLF